MCEQLTPEEMDIMYTADEIYEQLKYKFEIADKFRMQVEKGKMTEKQYKIGLIFLMEN